MIFGFAYLIMVLIITSGWVLIAILPKPGFIEKPMERIKENLRVLINTQKEGK